jgi:hypothetical protein
MVHCKKLFQLIVDVIMVLFLLLLLVVNEVVLLFLVSMKKYIVHTIFEEEAVASRAMLMLDISSMAQR